MFAQTALRATMSLTEVDSSLLPVSILVYFGVVPLRQMARTPRRWHWGSIRGPIGELPGKASLDVAAGEPGNANYV